MRNGATEIYTERNVKKKRTERLAQRHSRIENIKSKPAKRREMKKLKKNNEKFEEAYKSHLNSGEINVHQAESMPEYHAPLSLTDNSVVDLNSSEINLHESSPIPEYHDEDCEVLQRESDAMFDESEMPKSSDKVACILKNSDISVQNKNNACADKSVQVCTDNFTIKL